MRYAKVLVVGINFFTSTGHPEWRSVSECKFGTTIISRKVLKTES